MKTSLPDWLWRSLGRALVGEIYPNIRAITAHLSEEGRLDMTYYLDREATDYDTESISLIEFNISTETMSDSILAGACDIVYTLDFFKNIDFNGEVIYARRESSIM
jgi:hypothetical protein